jgi:hypothetical protein
MQHERHWKPFIHQAAMWSDAMLVSSRGASCAALPFTLLIMLLIFNTSVHSDEVQNNLPNNKQADIEQRLDRSTGYPEISLLETRILATASDRHHHRALQQITLFALDARGYLLKAEPTEVCSLEARKSNISDQVRHRKLIQNWVATLVPNDKGVDVTDFDLAGIRLFMSYNQVMKALQIAEPESKIADIDREPCAQDRIESINKAQMPQRNCLRKIVIEPKRKVGESYKIDIFFSEDLPTYPGLGIVKAIVYTKYFGRKDHDLNKFTMAVIQRYGKPVFVTEHFFGHGTHDKPRFDLPYLYCCSKIGYPYRVFLSAGTRFEIHMGKISRQTVSEATQGH